MKQQIIDSYERSKKRPSIWSRRKRKELNNLMKEVQTIVQHINRRAQSYSSECRRSSICDEPGTLTKSKSLPDLLINMEDSFNPGSETDEEIARSMPN
jgi:hypothetical protein